MTTVSAREYDQALLQATDELIRRHPNLAAGRVIAAVARAKIHIRDLYSTSGQETPDPAEYIAVIIAMAAQQLTGQPGWTA